MKKLLLTCLGCIALSAFLAGFIVFVDWEVFLVALAAGMLVSLLTS